MRSEILKAAVAKARGSFVLEPPKSIPQAQRRLRRYEAFASASPKKPAAGRKARVAIAQTEADTLRRKILPTLRRIDFTEAQAGMKARAEAPRPDTRTARGARRAAVNEMIGRTMATGKEHGFVDAGARRIAAGEVTPTGQKLNNSRRRENKNPDADIFHTHPSSDALAPRQGPSARRRVREVGASLSVSDIGSVFARGGRGKLWMTHPETGAHEAARLTARAAAMPKAERAKAFESIARRHAGSSLDPTGDPERLKRDLRRAGLLQVARSAPRPLRASEESSKLIGAAINNRDALERKRRKFLRPTR